MRINNNMLAMNTHRQMGITGVNQGKSMEKLSSGQRINRAGDDAAGLAISEKMRGQIRGLNMASKNSQDGISMIQTAEGALNETHAILQRMRELAVQSGNDTNVTADRSEIQKEMNQLTTEINRIGNTTEFNTQSVLKGDGRASLEKTNLATISAKMGDKVNGSVSGSTVHTGATVTVAAAATASGATGTTGKSKSFNINGEILTVNYVEDLTLDTSGTGKVDLDTLTGNSVTIKFKGVVTASGNGDLLSSALNSMIGENSTIAGSYDVTSAATSADVVIKANDTGKFAGEKGFIGAGTSQTGIAADVTANTGTTTHVDATMIMDFTSQSTPDKIKDLIGKGMTIGDTQFEFYNADKGAYTGNAVGINISSAVDATTLGKAIADQLPKDEGYTAVNAAGKLTLTSTIKGKAGNDSLVSKDGGVQEAFKSNFQVGANQGQSMTIEIKDMRSNALGLTGKAGDAGFTTVNSVTNGTNNNAIEAALDVSTHEKAAAAITVVNAAIEKVSAQRSDLGSFQNRLEHTIKNLDTSAENLQAAESRVRDVDMAKEMMNLTKNNILQQASQAMMAQANSAPQGVLQLLR